MKSSRLRWIFIVVGSLSLIISYLGIWIRFINNPVERTGSDFIAFYTAGRVAQSYGAAYVYNISLQQDIQEEQVGFPLVPGQVLLYNHLPFLIPILHILVSADYVGSFYRWIFLLIALFITSISVLSGVLKDARFDSSTRLIAGVGSLLFLPLFFSLMNGQDSALLLLGTALWMYGLSSGKEITAGLGLSLTTIRPHLALILALPMLFSYRKVFLGFILGSGVLALLSFLILGMQGTREFIDILFISANGEWYGMKESAMYNLIGLLVRTIPWLEVSTIRAVGWSIYGVTGIGLCIVWARNRNIQDGQIGLTVTLGLFVAPHLHFHDLTLLLIPIYELIRSSTRSAGLKTSIAIALPIAISLLLLLSNSYPLLQYSIPYLILLSLAGYPYYQKYKMPIPAPHQSSSPER